MNVTYACPGCERTTRSEFTTQTHSVACRFCEHEIVLPDQAVVEDGIHRCLVCPSRELYKRKNFPQKIGVTIAIIGFAISCIPWYYHLWYATFAILFATAIFDAVLYLCTTDLLQCYRCHSQYRDVGDLSEHGDFSLEVHEKFRQEAARLRDFESQQPIAARDRSS